MVDLQSCIFRGCEVPVFSINLRSSLTWNGSTWYDPISDSNNGFMFDLTVNARLLYMKQINWMRLKLVAFHINPWNHSTVSKQLVLT